MQFWHFKTRKIQNLDGTIYQLHSKQFTSFISNCQFCSNTLFGINNYAAQYRILFWLFCYMILLCRRNTESAKLIHCCLWWQITNNDRFLMICQKVYETGWLWGSNCQEKLLWMLHIESIYNGSLLSLTTNSDGVHFTLGNSSFPYEWDQMAIQRTVSFFLFF